MTRFVLLLFAVGIFVVPVQAQQKERADTTSGAADADWLVLPFASYAPETKLAGGIVGGYYRPEQAGRSASSIQTTVTITQKRQLIVQATPELYLAEGQWRVQGELQGSHFPDSFYGIGPATPARAEEEYTARYVYVDGAAQWRLSSRLRVGPRLYARVGSVDPETDAGLIAENRVIGADGGQTLGVGASALWDARNSLYYPTDGSYGEGVVTLYSAAWGSDFTFGQFKTDLRGYRPLGPGTLAAQVYAEAVVGDAPFQLRPLFGGAERMRGYREGRFRDDLYWTTQAEYRFPLFWRFKGVAFASLGQVGSRIGPSLVEHVEGAVGLGGRLRLTEGGVHGRLDVAYGRTGVELYIALGEAF